VKEIVPKALLAWLARVLYKENYVAMPMSSTIQEGHSYDYRWGANSLKLTSTGKTVDAEESSLARFITEHY
jgi:Uncharacterized conserved protein (COG2071)